MSKAWLPVNAGFKASKKCLLKSHKGLSPFWQGPCNQPLYDGENVEKRQKNGRTENRDVQRLKL